MVPGETEEDAEEIIMDIQAWFLGRGKVSGMKGKHCLLQLQEESTALKEFFSKFLRCMEAPAPRFHGFFTNCRYPRPVDLSVPSGACQPQQAGKPQIHGFFFKRALVCQLCSPCLSFQFLQRLHRLTTVHVSKTIGKRESLCRLGSADS